MKAEKYVGRQHQGISRDELWRMWRTAENRKEWKSIKANLLGADGTK